MSLYPPDPDLEVALLHVEGVEAVDLNSDPVTVYLSPSREEVRVRVMELIHERAPERQVQFIETGKFKAL